MKTLSVLPVLAWPGTRLVAVLSKAIVLPSLLSTGAKELPLAGVAGEPPAPLTSKLLPATEKPAETPARVHRKTLLGGGLPGAPVTPTRLAAWLW